MAASGLLVVLCQVLILHYCSCFGFLDDFIGGETACEQVCQSTYPLHTYEKAAHLGFCQRGCRLFNIIDFMDEGQDLNATRDACACSCQEAHMSEEDRNACTVGCSGQIPFAQKRRKELEAEDFQMQMVNPFLYVHSVYSNMMDKVSRHMSVSWSFYIHGDTGTMVITKSEPRFFVEISDGDEEYKTSNYIESNLAAVDNSATPNLKHSQMHPVEHSTRYALDVHGNEVQRNGSNDWLGCIAKKTGLPRLLISFTIFVSVMIMLWLCFFTAVAPSESKIQPQKLSIYGDLEYLNEMQAQKLLSKTHPQDKQQAAPLPIKISVERI